MKLSALLAPLVLAMPMALSALHGFGGRHVTDTWRQAAATGSLTVEEQDGTDYFSCASATGICNFTTSPTAAGGAIGVTGPGSSTNTALAVWNGTGGTTLANSEVTFNGTTNQMSFADASSLIFAGFSAIQAATTGIGFNAGDVTLTGYYEDAEVADVASVAAAGCTDSANLTDTGLALGDSCEVGTSTAPEAGMNYRCYVTAANTWIVRACNSTGVAVDPVSRTYTGRFLR